MILPAMLSLFFTLIISFYASESVVIHPKDLSVPQKPVLPDRYYVKGTLYLPYAELSEPFEAWIDGKGERSRIDFYGGMSIVVQRGDMGKYGKSFLIAPVTNEVVKNQRTCFTWNGATTYHIKHQNMFPDISNFKYIGDKAFMGQNVNVWQYKSHLGYKYSTYNIYISTSTMNPIYYEMRGRNTLLGSHIDVYQLTYNKMAKTFADDVFDLPMAKLKCRTFSASDNEAKIISNPMAEYIHPVDDSHVHHMHQDFRKRYNKTYTDDVEVEKRKNNFKHNLRYINSMNRKNLSFKLKVNHLADYSLEELQHLRGRRPNPSANTKEDGSTPFIQTISATDIPESKNWRLYGAVTPVKDQAICGSCWTFGTTGTIEGAIFRKTGRRILLSQQQLVDCAWGFGNLGCNGGWETHAYKYLMKHGGIATEEDYGHYLAVDGFCHADKLKKINITGFVRIPTGNVEALRTAVAQVGPVSVGIDASRPSFAFYSHGVYYDSKCRKTINDLDHVVLVVGYGTMNGEPYWLIKNSWSTYWGNDGYVLVSRKDNNCGIATDASYAKID